MLSKNKKIAYGVILAVLTATFLLTSTNPMLKELEVAAQTYYRGEYKLTTYYPAPYGRYQDLVAMGKVGVGTTPSTTDGELLYIKGADGGADTVLKVEDPDSLGSIGAYLKLVSSSATVPWAGVIFNNGTNDFWHLGTYGGTNLVINREVGSTGSVIIYLGDIAKEVEIGQGTTDGDITFIALRNESGTKCYIYPNAAGNDIVVSTTKP